ncbi:MAG: hypothetical protein Q4P33_02240 [Flaviflexus sp.]|nr:hypothetical protein [Flaviflexus sp.]
MNAQRGSSREVISLLKELREALATVSFPLDLPQAVDGREETADLIHQFDDYVLPRYASLEAPLLAVVGGSTGSGKSALVNALVREQVASSTAIRPTTRRPLLVHHPADAEWFGSDRILPELARVRGAEDSGSHTELGLAETTSLPEGLALLDSPDIDSVVEDNRRLAAQLLAAADLWVFVTTAARYSDAIPWALLDDAAGRDVVVAVVLNRIPPGVGAEVRADLARRLEEHGLEHAPLFAVMETAFDEDGFIPQADIEPIRQWLAGLAADTQARVNVARQTLGGAVDQIIVRASSLVPALGEQRAALVTLASQVDDAFDRAQARVLESVDDGSVLRGEVLARWQDFVGTGEILRQVEERVGRFRDRITAWFKGSSVPEPEHIEEAIEHGIAGMLIGETEAAIAAVERSWARGLGGEELAGQAAAALRSHEDRERAAQELVREWQRSIMHLVEHEGEDRRATARILSFGLNTVAVALMIVIFASTAGLSGGEVVVAGSTAVIAQKLLEAIFGDEAVRKMAQAAKNDLEQRTGEFLLTEAEAFRGRLATLGVDAAAAEDLAELLALLRGARRAEGGR